ncbi:MAG: C39 family peptidase [Patescibacteria group bacterium]|nr:C39 family peptidase [Patescibacteria group bacterium]
MNVQAASVPFLVQAPLNGWRDYRLAQGCEEAAALMAVAWAKGQTSIAPADGRKQIIAISNWEKKNYGYYVDTSIQDTANHIIKGYLKYDKIEVKENITTSDIVSALNQGDIVLVAINGRKIESPYYRKPGPLHHTVVVIGYNANTEIFTVHDPGSSHGANWQVKKDILQSGLQNYESGKGTSRKALPPAMIVVSK